MTEAEENYGKKFDYDPQWKGPLGIERRRTDLPFIVSYGIYLVLWLGIAIYGYSAGDIHSFNRAKRFTRYGDEPNYDFSLKQLLAAKNVVTCFALLSLVLSLTYIILLRWFAKFIVYMVIFLICAILFVGITFFSYMYAQSQRTEMFIGIIGLSIVFLTIVIVFLLVRKKIRIACEVIGESSKVITFFPSSLMFPVLPYILHGITVSFTGSVLVFLAAIPQDYNGTPAHIYFFHFVNFFGFLWTVQFINAFAQMVLSGSFATWYWTMEKKYIPDNTIVLFMAKTVRYHLGTLAFGSLILAICRVMNMILNFISNRLKGSCNPLACFFFGWYKFLFGRLEKFLRYLNRNAYIMCTIHGDGFIESAKNAFNLLMRNIIKVLVINKVTDLILCIGHILVIGLSILATWGYCHNQHLDNIMPIALVMVGGCALLISVSFSMVLRTAIDTIFLSVMEDYERNDGTVEKPYYMSFKLKELLLQ